MRDDTLSRRLGDYRSWLYKQAISLLGEYGHPDVDDLVQEGYIAMWRALESYDEAKGSLPGWLTYKARNRMLECVTKWQWTGQPRRAPGALQAAREAGEVLSLSAPVEGRLEGGDILADLLEAPDLIEAVLRAYHDGDVARAIAALSPKQRDYVEARFWCGFTDAEMNEYFGYEPTGLRRLAFRNLTRSLAHLAEIVT